MSRRSPWLLLALLVPSGAVRAQTTIDTLSLGQRVRVAYECRAVRVPPAGCRDRHLLRTDVGQVQVIDHDTLRLRRQAGGTEIPIARSSIAQLWVGEGHKSHIKVGAELGLFLGPLIGGYIGSKRPMCFVGGCSSTASTVAGVVTGLPAGLLLGVIVGAFVQTETWHVMPLAAHPIRIGPTPDGHGLAAAIVF